MTYDASESATRLIDEKRLVRQLRLDGENGRLRRVRESAGLSLRAVSRGVGGEIGDRLTAALIHAWEQGAQPRLSPAVMRYAALIDEIERQTDRMSQSLSVSA